MHLGFTSLGAYSVWRILALCTPQRRQLRPSQCHTQSASAPNDTPPHALHLKPHPLAVSLLPRCRKLKQYKSTVKRPHPLSKKSKGVVLQFHKLSSQTLRKTSKLPSQSFNLNEHLCKLWSLHVVLQRTPAALLAPLQEGEELAGQSEMEDSRPTH